MLGSISIIMPNYNHGDHIVAAIKSCLMQKHLEELIIVDGGSTDNSIVKVKNLLLKDNRIKLINEKDKGPADALNKALEISKGKIIGWLNSDDIYCKNTFVLIDSKFKEDKNLKMVYGYGAHVDINGQFLELYPSKKPHYGIEEFKNGCFICQPTVFLKRDFLEERHL